ncbi:hypothetical protein KC19_3G011800 [Ceratodon purpureus]|uniref:Uncharacterized protein n=1 Tax=Ceratodon purpureus TaxID=3225 RepID=A0A8T0IG22_CERPU|nr:hypothetical protein KC19_3G011800 [Ceratodon purpureus]
MVRNQGCSRGCNLEYRKLQSDQTILLTMSFMYGAGSGILATYLGNSRDYVQSNVSRYFATHDIQYYFQVTDQYIKNKLKVVLCPFPSSHSKLSSSSCLTSCNLKLLRG